MRAADPGFRLILALMEARSAHRRLGRLLPDWPQDIKDTHDTMRRQLDTAWGAAWDVFCGDDASACRPSENPGKDATADVSAEPVDSSAAIPDAVLDHIERCGE